jgi:SAM-dependent methyltransferase
MIERKKDADDAKRLQEKTIADFGEQWSRYTDNCGWYGSTELFEDMIRPLLSASELQGATVAEIGSGTGRIVRMLCDVGVSHVYAVEPAAGAFLTLRENIIKMERTGLVTAINTTGAEFQADRPLDYAFSIGVLHHIPDPRPVLFAIHRQLKPGGGFFAWVYAREGNEMYFRLCQPLRWMTSKMSHAALRGCVEVLYWLLVLYKSVSMLLPLPQRDYIKHVLWPMGPQKRRLVIYDQLNPAYAKYYREAELIELFRSCGFQNIKTHHRHGYSWAVIAQKAPTAEEKVAEETKAE